MDAPACTLCDDHGDCIAVRSDGEEIRKCRGCGLVFASARPDRDETPNIYAPEEASDAAHVHLVAEYGERLHARHNLKIIKAHGGSGNILELGAGAGFFLDEARDAGFTAYGVEMNRTLASYAKEHLGLVCAPAPLGFAGVPATSIDVLYHCDVLTHLPDPVVEFDLMHRSLIERGLLVFETFSMGPSRDECMNHLSRLDRPDHKHYFSEHNIEHLLDKTGFDLVKIYRYALLPQIAFKRKLAELRRRVFGEHTDTPVEPNDETQVIVPPKNSLLDRFSRNLRQSIDFVLRYKLGRVVPAKNRPQTIIVVARRRS